MKSLLVMACLILAVSSGYSLQQANMKTIVNADENTSSDVTSSAPAFPGGESALLDFISKSLKYPKMAIEEKTEGQVIVRFQVDADGMVKNAYVPKGKGLDKWCDDEAIRVIMSSPKWNPALRMGIPVAVWYIIPITFQLIHSN